MLKVVTGAFRPDLEQACAAEVRRVKTADPLASLLLLVPSHPLRIRLTEVLCCEPGWTMLNVRVLTFHQLALDLLAEADWPRPERFPSETFFAELVGSVFRRHEATMTEWASFCQVPGAWEALWRTIQDLKNAGLDADRLEALLNDRDPAAARLQASDLARMFRLAARVLRDKDRLGAFDYDDLLAQAAEAMPESRRLRQCRRVICYGAYDLNQLQLDFFRALTRVCDITWYFPLIDDHPAFVFARQFFDRHVQGLRSSSPDADDRDPGATSPEGLGASGSSSAPASPLRDLFDESAQIRASTEPDGASPSIRLLAAASLADELDVIAKDMLERVEEHGYAFHEIGLVARSLEGYDRLIPSIFAQHRIPFAGSLSRPLAEYPLAQVVQVLLEARETNYRRDRVLELLGSPFFRLPDTDGKTLRTWVDYWDVVTRRLTITRGIEQWRRLADYGERGLTSPENGDEDEHVPVRSISAEAIASLWRVVADLHARLQRFPERGNWETFLDTLLELCDRYLIVPDERAIAEDSGTFIDQGGAVVAQAFRHGLEDLRRLAGPDDVLTFADFASSVRRLLRRTTVPVSEVANMGVRVLDAMEARGLSFRVLYVVGVTDDRFPRGIQEDAFLRDTHRRWIELDLGYKIPEKLAAAQEEKLLWYLLVNSARESLVLSYPRADERHRPLTPSPYLLELERVTGSIALERVPRTLTDKTKRVPQYREDRLVPRDLGILRLARRQRDDHELSRLHHAWPHIERALVALEAQERESESLGVFDGCIGPLEHVERRLAVSGCSPTSLDEYGLCPFRYFASRVLKLEELADPNAVEEVGRSEWGTLIHEILRETYARLDASAYFTREEQGRVDPMTVLETVARAVFSRFAAEMPVGYAVFWESQCDRVLSYLRKVVQADIADLTASGWRPVRFEEPIAGTVGEAIGVPLTIRGRLDRVDWHRDQRAIRIVDYKCRWSSQPDAHDRDLALSAIRARKFQPPLYLAAVAARPREWLAADGQEPLDCEGIWFYYLAPRWTSEESRSGEAENAAAFVRAKFPGDAWRSDLRGPLQDAVNVVVDGIRSGRFFIRPGPHCDHCAYFALCRKTHQQTRRRVRRDPDGSARLHRLARATLPSTRESSGK